MTQLMASGWRQPTGMCFLPADSHRPLASHSHWSLAPSLFSLVVKVQRGLCQSDVFDSLQKSLASRLLWGQF